MSGTPYLSICTATFMSAGDLQTFKEKAMTFNSEKAVDYLKQNGQINFSIIEAADDDSRAMVIWEYENEEGRDKCQEFWNSWFKYEDNYMVKGTWLRGHRTFDWSTGS